MTPHRIATYAGALRDALPAAAFEPRPWRLAWLPLHLIIIVLATAVIALGWGGLPAAAVLALVIGHGFAGMAFVGHEVLHGSVVRARWARHLVGWVAFLPFTISPRLWVVWHNRVHHGHTAEDGVDPDAYPSLAEYRRRPVLRLLDRFALGHGHPAGAVSLLVGLTGQSLQALRTVGGDRRYMTRREHALAIGETLAAAACWIAVGLTLGPRTLLFAWLLPLLVGNAVVMSYILTNHGLSPYTEVNDPLLNSLSVTTPRVLSILHLNFGYHVEHHVFPAMSPANAPAVSRLLRERWPARYQSMPLARALRALALTPRIRGTATTLVDPATGRSWPTLLPRERPTPPRPPAAAPAGEAPAAPTTRRALIES